MQGSARELKTCMKPTTDCHKFDRSTAVTFQRECPSCIRSFMILPQSRPPPPAPSAHIPPASGSTTLIVSPTPTSPELSTAAPWHISWPTTLVLRGPPVLATVASALQVPLRVWSGWGSHTRRCQCDGGHNWCPGPGHRLLLLHLMLKLLRRSRKSMSCHSTGLL